MSRHMNYVFELALALTWTLPAVTAFTTIRDVTPFSYLTFLTVLLVHRTFRDEEKCASKYGKDWTKYTDLVPYRLIPYVF